MDIKLKKSRLAVSFTTWFLGIVITFISLYRFIGESIYYQSDFAKRITEVFKEDYQETEEFRYVMSDYLNNFLTMSVNGPINYYYEVESILNSFEYSEAANETVTDNLYVDVAQAEVITKSSDGDAQTPISSLQAIEDAEAVDAETIDAETVYGGTQYSTVIRDEDEYNENRKRAQAYHDSIKDSTNMLYSIGNKEEILYTNEEGLGFYEENFVLPEGYNYVLSFDGEKVNAIKDGKPVDLYGDGIYGEDNSWYIPGYKNFPVDDSIKDSRICIVLPETPTVEVTRNYSKTINKYDNNIFYQIQLELSTKKMEYIRWTYSLAAGLVLLGISLFMHKYKKEANRTVAHFTNKIWFEAKLLPLLVFGYFIFNLAFLFIRDIYWREDIMYRIWQLICNESYRGYQVTALTVFVAAAFFIWILGNDTHYNHKIWKQSLTYKIVKIYRTSLLKVPISKRIVKRSLLLFLSEALLIIIVYIFCIRGVYWSYFYQNDALVISGISVFIIICVCQLILAMQNKNMVEDMDLLVSRIGDIHDGKILKPYEVSQKSDFKEVIENLNDIQYGMDNALKEQIKSERMKVELIANVSHDIKTPLTSIISYVDLLKQEENLPEYVKEYISILENKSQRLKMMVQDVFEVSKAASGELPVHMENLDLGKLLRQTLADMSEQIETADVTVKPEIMDRGVSIYADGERLYRVFQNLIQNALKYSLEGSRIYVTLHADGEFTVASIKNISKEEIPADVDYTERFARGDKSRSDGGSGLGLSIAQSFTEACGGTFKIDINADLFVVSVSFKETEADGLEQN